ncbi:MAG: 50S ribosomal protein L23 [Candidatus Paceibacterota bacterium]|jgi:large subunit ribosomal protein L23
MAEKKEKKNIKEKPKGKYDGTPIKSARMTEKAALGAEKGVYVFNVSDKATKIEVKKAIKKLFKVDVMKVAMVTTHPEMVFVRGRKGIVSGGKKAYVYLKKGQKIEVM